MPATTFQFDRDFQIGILALTIQSYEFLITALDLVQPPYFEDQTLVWVFKTIRDHFADYGARADQAILNNELLKANASGRVKDEDLDTYKEVIGRLHHPVNIQAYVVDEVVRFCRRQEVRRAMLEMAPKIETDDDGVWDEIIERMQKSCTVGAHSMDVGTMYFKQYIDRLRARMAGTETLIIPTGISELDQKLGGGLKAGQLGIWLGGTGVGKSIALPHCGKAAIFRDFKVVHYTLELNEEDICIRYDAAWTAVPVHELVTMNAQVEKKLGDLYTRYGNSLLIKDYPTGTATVAMIKAHLQSLRADNFIPHLVVVDYGDLMKPSISYQNAYEDLGIIFTDLRGLAGELKIPIWTATQVNRTGYSQEVADVDTMGDSFKKAQIADVVIAICATPEEMEQDALRLFIAKNRNGPSKHTVKIRSAYDRMCFYRPVAAPFQAPPKAPAAPPPPGMPPKKTTRQPRAKV